MEQKTDRKGGLLHALGVRYAVLVTILVLGLVAVTLLTRSSKASGDPATPAASSSQHLTWCESTNDLSSCLPKTCSGHARTIVYVGAKWCPWCQRLHDITFKDARVRQHLSEMGRVHVDVDDAQNVARRFHVHTLPTIIVLDGACHERGRFDGYYDPGPFLKKLAQIN